MSLRVCMRCTAYHPLTACRSRRCRRRCRRYERDRAFVRHVVCALKTAARRPPPPQPPQSPPLHQRRSAAQAGKVPPPLAVAYIHLLYVFMHLHTTCVPHVRYLYFMCTRDHTSAFLCAYLYVEYVCVFGQFQAQSGARGFLRSLAHVCDNRQCVCVSLETLVAARARAFT